MWRETETSKERGKENAFEKETEEQSRQKRKNKEVRRNGIKRLTHVIQIKITKGN